MIDIAIGNLVTLLVALAVAIVVMLARPQSPTRLLQALGSGSLALGIVSFVVGLAGNLADYLLVAGVSFGFAALARTPIRGPDS